jgi:hypothetical protein
MDPIQVSLNTRSGTRAGEIDFSSCRWILSDPIIMPPGNEHSLFVGLTHISLPGDHFRCNVARGTTTLGIETRVDGDDANLVRRRVSIPEGSYSRVSYIQAMQRALDLAGVDMILEISDGAPSPTWPVYHVRCFSTVENEEHRIRGCATCPDFNASEVLGFHRTGTWASTTVGSYADSPMDTQGTRTVTINAREVATNAPDPVTLNRRRTVLAVVPAPNGEAHRTFVWERKVVTACAIPARHLCVIELSLTDDLGNPYNPRHHWSVGLEISAQIRQHFVVNM